MNKQTKDLGKLLKERRAYHGWTLAEVSSMTGIATSTLSKIENGHISPNFDTILKLSHGLGVEIGDLLNSPPSEPTPPLVVARRSISRNFEGQRLDRQHYSYSYLSADVAHKRIIPIYIEVQAMTPEEMGPLTAHVGEEFMLVLSGKVRLYSEYYEPMDLEQGDSVYLDSTMKHGYMSLQEPTSSILVCCSSATPNLAQTLREIIKDQIIQESHSGPKAD
ncbi:XRE family transcriptional regulator [Mesorhizobium sp. AD1-1]|uniref:helix-turn-helix domain-containing protein n=1 Tax=Mesorhizobium sp. B263B2A TaxID=2876669 RepID=UPI001CD03C82|nr:XRE family transcriptional regulator [Mesorhizobium sp. B263B2A]MBZ9719298.1 XRE family transcriptional regulator [Mesorhizobium sp. AD1-1]MCA0030485.1 XRE family transcriptional regulator [Mesorhizobium sp. B263B2A]